MTESMTARLAALRRAVESLAERSPAALTLVKSGEPDREDFAFPTLSEELCDADALAELAARAAELGPWHQGPFQLGETLVLGGAARDGERWSALTEQIGPAIEGTRALVVGCGAGFDAFALAAGGAEYVLAGEPSETMRQAELLESVYRSGAAFRRTGWEDLDGEQDGRFDLVLCVGLIHRVLDPIALLRKLHEMTGPGGLLVLGAMMLSEPERSEFLRFVPGRHDGDPDTWFVPGRLALRWMLQAVGFGVEAELVVREGPRDGFPVVDVQLLARKIA